MRKSFYRRPKDKEINMNKFRYDLYNKSVHGKDSSYKTCKKCNKSKHKSDFYSYNNRITDWCIHCFIDYSEKRYPAPYEEYLASLKYYANNKKEISFLLGNGYSIRNNKKMSSTGFLNTEISGICLMCGEILIFGTYHHILGDQSDFTVMLCNECHSTDGNTQVNYHCSSIGRRIEAGALCWY